MFERNRKLFGRAVLLLLLLSALCAWMIPMAFADPAETYDLTVNFDSQYCSAELYVNDSAFPIQMESGAAQTIPEQSKIRVQFRFVPGYDATVKANDEITPLVSNSYSDSFFSKDTVLDVEIRNKTFVIDFIPGDWRFLSNAGKYFDNTNPITYTFKGDAVVIDPVAKNGTGEQGYNFVGWESVTDDGAGGYRVIGSYQVSANNGKMFTFNPGDNIQEEWQSQGKIYLRPKFEPNQFWVSRYDLVVPDASHAAPEHALLRLNRETPYTWKADYESDVRGAAEDADRVSPYPGYSYLSDQGAKVSVKTEENPNLVYRFFVAITYDLTFDWNGGAMDEGQTEPLTHTYDLNTALPVGSRTGFTFGGWSVKVNDAVAEEITDAEKLYLSKENPAYTVDNDAEDARKITLVAIWNPVSYPIDFDLAGGTAAPDTPEEYVFDTALEIPNPTRVGYTFTGWKVNDVLAPVNAAEGETLTLAALTEEYVSALSLTAVWQANTYTVTLDAPDATTAGSTTWQMTFDAVPDTEGIELPARAQYSFAGFFYEAAGQDPVLIISADGTSAGIPWTYPEDAVLSAHWELLPPTADVAATDLSVDYLREVILVNKASHLLISCEGSETVLDHTTASDGIADPIALPDEFFGQTIHVTVRGDDVTTSDCHMDLDLAARPAAPAMGTDVLILDSGTQDSISVGVTGNDENRFEFALFLDAEGTVMKCDWQSGKIFAELDPGTDYYVFARLKATAQAPHGQAAGLYANTQWSDFLQETLTRLDALLTETDGELAHAVVEDAKEAALSLPKPSATFYGDLNDIYDTAAQDILFARRKDQKIAALIRLCSSLIDSKSFCRENEELIDRLLSQAVAAITAETDDDAVQALFDQYYNSITDVKLNYLTTDNGLTLTSTAGLDRGAKITLIRFPDFASVGDAVSRAIRSGNVSAPDDETRSAADSLDVIAAYSMKLTDTAVSPTERFEIRLLLPEDLRDATGIAVGYYDETTGELRMLESYREGNELFFTADAVHDFVILGDPVVRMTAAVIALSAVLLCQIIAIVFLAVRRKKNSVKARSTAILPLAFLTVRFLPAHAWEATLILGILVVAAQVVLLWLLLGSDVVRRSRKQQEEKTEQPEDGESVPAYAGEPATDGEEPAGAPEGSDDGEEPVTEESDGESGFADEAENGYDDDFIEPAANPRYSLPDEDAGEGGDPSEWTPDDAEEEPEPAEPADEPDSAGEESDDTPADGTAYSYNYED